MKEPRQEKRQEGELFRPTAEWLAAFREQLTLAVLEQLTSYARPRAQRVAAVGGTNDIAAYVEDVVKDAVRKVREGTIGWQHDRVPLELVLIYAIKSRTRHDRERAEKYRHDSIAHPTARSRRAELDASEAVAAGKSRPDDSVYCREVVAYLRIGAGADLAVQCLLDGYVAGARCKADVCHQTGMADMEYHKARIRLSRLIERLGLSPFKKQIAA